VTRIFQSLPASELRHKEVLVVDDNSSDNTAEEVERLREGGYNVHLHIRKTERGLSSAVLHGFSLAHGSKLVVMDADLQHPPENVYDLLSALPDQPEGATIPPPQFALGTRYGKGVEIDRDWPLYRRIISWGARVLSRPLTNAQDPMGGFFALRKELVSLVQPKWLVCADNIWR
jgi:dolichol-phosphate mannosyltransferase